MDFYVKHYKKMLRTDVSVLKKLVLTYLEASICSTIFLALREENDRVDGRGASFPAHNPHFSPRTKWIIVGNWPMHFFSWGTYSKDHELNRVPY